MPLEPIRELVLQNVETTLKTIVQGDNYWNTVADVRRVLDDPHTAEGITLYIFSPGDETVEHDGKGTNFSCVQTIMSIDVIAVVEITEASATESQRLAADIERAMLQDRQRGTTALNTRIKSRTIVDGETEGGQMVISFDVTYRTQFGEPGVQL